MALKYYINRYYIIVYWNHSDLKLNFRKIVLCEDFNSSVGFILSGLHSPTITLYDSVLMALDRRGKAISSQNILPLYK